MPKYGHEYYVLDGLHWSKGWEVELNFFKNSTLSNSVIYHYQYSIPLCKSNAKPINYFSLKKCFPTSTTRDSL